SPLLLELTADLVPLSLEHLRVDHRVILSFVRQNAPSYSRTKAIEPLRRETDSRIRRLLGGRRRRGPAGLVDVDLPPLGRRTPRSGDLCLGLRASLVGAARKPQAQTAEHDCRNKRIDEFPHEWCLVSPSLGAPVTSHEVLDRPPIADWTLQAACQ